MKIENNKYKCDDCGIEYTKDDFLFESFFNPYLCDDCERQHRDDSTYN